MIWFHDVSCAKTLCIYKLASLSDIWPFLSLVKTYNIRTYTRAYPEYLLLVIYNNKSELKEKINIFVRILSVVSKRQVKKDKIYYFYPTELMFTNTLGLQ